jgi:hypothetical protein
MDASKRLSNGWLLMTQSFKYLFKKENILFYTLIASCILSFVSIYLIRHSKGFIDIAHAFTPQFNSSSVVFISLTIISYLTIQLLLFIAHLIGTLLSATLYYYVIRDLQGNKVSFYASLLETKNRFQKLFLWQLLSFAAILFISILSGGHTPSYSIITLLWCAATAFVLPILMTTSLTIFTALSNSVSIFINTCIEITIGVVEKIILFGSFRPLLFAMLATGINRAIETPESIFFLWLLNIVLLCIFFLGYSIWIIFIATLYLYSQSKSNTHFSSKFKTQEYV